MKINQKILTIVLGSVAAVGIIAGGTMFGVGGNQTATISFGGQEATISNGWLNYDNSLFKDPQGEIMNFDKFLENCSTQSKDLPDAIKKLETAIASTTDANILNMLNTQLAQSKAMLKLANDTITMHGVAVAGVTIMSIGLAIGVFAAGMEIFKFVTKKDKVTVNK